MRFDRARESIEALEASGAVTIMDALNIFYDLCEDIRDSEASTVDKLPPGDPDRMVGRLCWAGRTLLRISKSNPEAVAGTDNAKRLEKICCELESQDNILARTQQKVKVLLEKQSVLDEKKQALDEALKQERRLSQDCRCMEGEIAEYETLKAPDLKQRHGQLVQRLDECRADAAQFRQQLETLQASLTTALSEKAELSEDVTDVQKRMTVATEQSRKLKRDYADLNVRLQSMDEEHRQLVESIRSLEERLDGTTLEGLKAELAARQAAVSDQEMACRQLEAEIRLKEDALYRLKQDWSGKNKYTQELAWEEENEQKKAEAELKGLQKRIEEARRRKQSLIEEKEQLAGALTELEEWFESLEVKNYKDRMDACVERIRVLKAARDGLFEELSVILAFSTDNVRENLTKYQKYFRDAMDDIEKSLEKYQACYRRVIGIFDDGGSLL